MANVGNVFYFHLHVYYIYAYTTAASFTTSKTRIFIRRERDRNLFLPPNNRSNVGTTLNNFVVRLAIRDNNQLPVCNAILFFKQNKTENDLVLNLEVVYGFRAVNRLVTSLVCGRLRTR